MKVIKEEKRREALKELKEILKGCKKDRNGYRLAIRIERVASSGMSRCLSIYSQKGEYKRNITHLVATINEDTYTKDGFVRVVGCGMDMLFDTCYRLNGNSRYLDKYKGHKKDSYNYIVSTYYDLI